ncbi:MAG TPA: OmcA/MtrC family decaheme c-type cytochrome [Candidatus Eisenbacteria bacterium]|nr:OmcA/MtrC family decaheme c-type cytochrome [Candidatus Eisenbacteria bacterium]
MTRGVLAASIVLLTAFSAGAVTLPGGGPKGTDCHLELMVNGSGFPAGKTFTGTTCPDGGSCDADGQINGSCHFTTIACINVADPAFPKCSLAQVSSIKWKGKVGKSKVDTSALDAAVAGLGLPSQASVCTKAVDFTLSVQGPNAKGQLVEGKAQLTAKAATTKGTDKDTYKFVCLPTAAPPSTGPTTTTITATTTTLEPTTSTSTTLPPTLGTPGAGLKSVITGVTISAAGQVVVTFTLTDTAGVAVVPKTGSTSDPDTARVRFTIARIQVDMPSTEGFSTTFTKYVNYITTHATSGSVSSDQPTFDSGGSVALVDAASGTWRYTFGKMLPAGFPGTLTHTVGAQIERTFEGEQLVANPTFDFVPAGGAVTTVREDTTTDQCNACHNPLQAHGGGRREVKLCILCHTDQAIDPDTGNTIDFKQMVHRLHMGKDLPSVVNGSVGAKYSIIGFQGSEAVFSKKVGACVNGPFPSAPCTADADCDGGTCTGTTIIGVGFPQDIRNCTKCHGAGATAANYHALPSTLACTGCHDDVNPGMMSINGLAPGTNHVPGQQPEELCRVCHKTAMDAEFDLTVPGAHTIPLRSTTLTGLQAEILSATGAPNMAVTVQFRLRDGAGNPITSYGGFNRIGFGISGPTTDYGGSSVPLIAPTAVGGGSTGTLVPPDGTGLATYTTAAMLPADAMGTWTIGLEARRAVMVNGQSQNEAAPNPVFDFSVDGSPVAPRRDVVTDANCSNCHGTFSKDFSIHGNLRNRVEYCVMCHNAKGSDVARRVGQIANGADPMTQSIAFKHMIHKIHRGEALEHQPYIVYGFSGGVDFGDVLFPGDLRDCETCHAAGTQFVPLPAGVLPTNVGMIDMGAEVVTGTTPPIQDACRACHDDDATAAHAETNTTASGAEACAVCHGEGSAEAVSVVHAR